MRMPKIVAAITVIIWLVPSRGTNTKDRPNTVPKTIAIDMCTRAPTIGSSILRNVVPTPLNTDKSGAWMIHKVPKAMPPPIPPRTAARVAKLTI